MAWDVVRQITDRRRLADDLGWTVAEKYLDDYLSAFSKRRSSNERRAGRPGRRGPGTRWS